MFEASSDGLSLILSGPVAAARRVVTSVPVLTVLFLIILDIALRQGNLLDAMGYATIDRWNLPPRIELCKRTVPDVALTGSSLLLVLNQDEHGGHFYSGINPPYLQVLLRKATGRSITCINLCTGLQMPSETYLIGEAITNQSSYPAVIILGIALRDLIHDQYAWEWSCESFASIAPYVPLRANVLSQLTSAQAVRELVLCHLWYLYRQRTDLQAYLKASAKEMLEYLPLDQSFSRLGFDHTWRRQRYGFLPERWVPRQQEKFTEEIYEKSPQFLKRYYKVMQASIYNQGTEGTMRIETHYLESLALLCQRKNIHLVLVNMPLSPEFQELVPPGLYDTFRDFLKSFASQAHVDLIDFYQEPEFGNDAFKDGVHLNFAGARVLAEKLMSELEKRYPAVLEAMTAHAEARQKLADHEQLEAAYQRLR